MARKATQKHGKGHSKKQHSAKVILVKGKRPLDQIQKGVLNNVPIEGIENLPANGKFACLKCDVYFKDYNTLQQHIKTKGHKKRLKEFDTKQHTTKDAEIAGGLY
ncbi:zinc finger protein 593-like [Arctopsyche grandis]|uniref:zinc finger protein 593-like n=1 Tax=Arctopsyche grandis TaxID=121162 RepID=UPI00406D784D